MYLIVSTRVAEEKIMAAREKKTIPHTFRITESTNKSLEEIANRERRNVSEVSYALLERGLLAYGRDGKLFEFPAGDEIMAISMQQIIIDLYGGIKPDDAKKFKRLAEQLGNDRAKEVADFDAAKKNSQKREPA